MSNNHPLMKCGHTANAVSGNRPVCAICCTIHPGWNEIDPGPPDLTGRIAQCGCGRTVPSSYDLAFFHMAEGPATWQDEDRALVEEKDAELKAFRSKHCKNKSPETKAEDERIRLEYVRARRIAESRKDITKSHDHFYCGHAGWD